MADLYGPDGKPIVRHTVYALGPNALTHQGSPTDHFAIFAKTQMQGGAYGPDLAPMIIATWVHASVAFAQCIEQSSNIDVRVSAMERVLARHRPDLHTEYIAELGAVQQERIDDALRAQDAALAQTVPPKEMH